MPNTLHLAYVLNQLAFVRVAAMFCTLPYALLDMHIYVIQSGLRIVRNYCMLVLRLCFVIVVSQHVVDTRQILYKYIIL